MSRQRHRFTYDRLADVPVGFPSNVEDGDRVYVREDDSVREYRAGQWHTIKRGQTPESERCLEWLLSPAADRAILMEGRSRVLATIHGTEGPAGDEPFVKWRTIVNDLLWHSTSTGEAMTAVENRLCSAGVLTALADRGAILDLRTEWRAVGTGVPETWWLCVKEDAETPSFLASLTRQADDSWVWQAGGDRASGWAAIISEATNRAVEAAFSPPLGVETETRDEEAPGGEVDREQLERTRRALEEVPG